MLTKSDYAKILKYYDLPVPTNLSKLKKNAEDVLSLKLCKCIKKVTPFDQSNEARAIGICTKSIFNKKGFTRGKFKCKNGRFVKFNKTKKNKK